VTNSEFLKLLAGKGVISRSHGVVILTVAMGQYVEVSEEVAKIKLEHPSLVPVQVKWSMPAAKDCWVGKK
jgi:hypothetical protein